MAKRFTFEQVKGLAPDPAALKAAQGLAGRRHWASLGCSAEAVWGECQGSAREPYKVRIDLRDNEAACTCPSRKAPCKHALGLMLLAASAPAELVEATAPAWVAGWLQKRAAPCPGAAGQAGAEERQKDAARRAARREKLVEEGLAALEQWLKDLARLGLAQAHNAPPSFWSEQAARLVDCQLPGAARLVGEMAALPGAHPEWAQALLLRLGRLYTLIQGYRRLAELPAAAQQDVRALLGWTVNQGELAAAGAGVADEWLVAASSTSEDEKTGLRTQVGWLWGRASRRPAQTIHFAARGQELEPGPLPGYALRGAAVYFPGGYPLRVVFKDRQPAGLGFVPAGYADLAALLDEYAAALGQDPWLERFPAVLEQVVPRRTGQGWFLCDQHDQALALEARFASPWELLALSGGQAVTVFCLWDGFALLPMACWAEGRFARL